VERHRGLKQSVTGGPDVVKGLVVAGDIYGSDGISVRTSWKNWDICDPERAAFCPRLLLWFLDHIEL